jgi:hypothetical protein
MGCHGREQRIFKGDKNPQHTFRGEVRPSAPYKRFYGMLKNPLKYAIILPVVLYGCETWSLTLRGQHRLRVFENWVLRRIFRKKRYKVTG